jgi:3-oxoacyl-[acyl-carrier-protein] synthase-3
MIKIKITGLGGYLPGTAVTNNDLPAHLQTSDEWISSRTGIKQRYFAAPEQRTSDLATNALMDAVTNFNLKTSDIDGIIVATTTPDYFFPATAVNVQRKIGLKTGFAFDIQAVCSGFVYGLATAASLIHSGVANKIVLIGAETMSRIVDWNDRSTCVLFGDGAGAVILEKTEQDAGILAVDIHSDGGFADILLTEGGISAGNLEAKLVMNGKEVFRHAIDKFGETILTCLDKGGCRIEDLDYVIPHQANNRIIQAIPKNLGIPAAKVISTVAEHANTSAASIPLAFWQSYNQGVIKPGQTIVLASVGAGLTWGSILLKF